MRIPLAVFLSLLFISSGAAQSEKWPSLLKEKADQIALINEVWYNTGERYIHPSFAYAATGFLVDTGKDTLAITAKHVLWIAKTKEMDAVALNGQLDRWIMHPKGAYQDSVIIDSLLNTDPGEMLNGPNSTITQREWLVFSTKYVDPDLAPIKISKRHLKAGDDVWYAGCPYQDENCFLEKGKVLEVEGTRIVFSKRDDLNVGGASGSPILDRRGRLVGILSGSATAKINQSPALFGYSVDYLLKVLNQERPLNVPLLSVGDFLHNAIERKGMTYATKQLYRLKKKRKQAKLYSFTPESINRLGINYREAGKLEKAKAVFQLSLSELPLTGTYVELAKVHQLEGDTEAARTACQKALELWPENEEAKRLLIEL